ncbi:apolipoprotein N-acyltransferase [Lysobacter brunescens]|uniref:Apolipoprotein N-acyltransferase n=1 Tax=Lysobacter brunescens TaxID=262323 RepID=A0ABW2YFM7_9GAMM
MSVSIVSGWRAAAGLVLSATLFGVYAQGGIAWPLGFVALVPWLLALDTVRGSGAALREGLLMSIAFVVAVFAWFGFAIGSYTGIGPGAGLAVLVVAAPLLQPQLIAFALVRHLVGRRHGPLLRALAGASAWVATEWLVPRLLDDTLGHGLHSSTVLRQGADLGGAPGLTFALILINEAVATAIARRRDGLRALAAPMSIALLLPMAMAGYGAWRLSSLTSRQSEDVASLRVGMVQANIVDYERLRREMGAYEVVRHILDTHVRLSRVATEQHDVDALLWSETVYPTTFRNPKSEAGAEFDQAILDLVALERVPLVFGTYDRDEAGEYNAAAFVEPGKGLLGFYRKTNPFPLTEYVPAWLDGPRFRALLPWAGTWRAGDGPRVFPLRTADGREVQVLPLICLDDVDSGLAIDGARLGAEAILGMSNDSWFTRYPVGAELHLKVAAFRSIETRMPQLRVTSNGISATIDARGEVVERTAMDREAVLVGTVHARTPTPTLMVRWGDWVGPTAFAGLLLFGAITLLRAARRRWHARHAPKANTHDGPLDVVLLTPFWRILIALLRVVARGGLLWMALQVLTNDGTPINPIAQVWMFAGLVLLPEAAAWSLMRAFAATLRIEGGMLVLEQPSRRIEIACSEIVDARTWRLPLPSTGLQLRLGSGSWRHAIAGVDPLRLTERLRATGATSIAQDSSASRAAILGHAVQATRHRLLDHPAFKFGLFPLLPALPAFRLHQVIAYGGTFGEWQTYGAKAWLLALFVWWASWAVNLAMIAAGLRVLVEVGTLLPLALRPLKTVDVRRMLEIAARVIFYIGVPLWLAVRLWPW